MIAKVKISTNLKIEKKEDLIKLKYLTEDGLKINISELSRELDCDRRTIEKHINGYVPKVRKKRKSQFDKYEQLIIDLLDNKDKVFAYKRVLYDYLKDNYQLKGSLSSFKIYITKNDKMNYYFTNGKKKTKPSSDSIRFETGMGEQAQIDWKESMNIVLKDGTKIKVNIFCFILSYSRFRIYRLSLHKTQDILFHFLNDCFETIQGVPKQLLTDNMRTVMDESRTKYKNGKVNIKFHQFALDYGFKVFPCIAGKPQTKAKIESPMRILDELLAYNGDLTFDELSHKLIAINERENKNYHCGYNAIPILSFQKEKDFLLPLPTVVIRKPYTIDTLTHKVNKSSMISYKSNMYSVPTKYIQKTVRVQVYENQLHIYYNTDYITSHLITTKKLNYHLSDYKELLEQALAHDDEKIEMIAKQNLQLIGEKYNDE